MSARVLFYVQHLLGVGHLRRAAVLTREMAKRGLKVTLVCGGFPIRDLDLEGVTLAQLPPLRSRDETFRELIDEEGRLVDDAWRNHRRDLLLEILAKVKPHALGIEMFPFGRRKLAFELIPLLETARVSEPRPWIFCSVRDVLNFPRKPNRAAEAVARVHSWFDRVLVHGDENLIGFEESFPLADEIASYIDYTGYVGGQAVSRAGAGHPGWNEVVVSAGGSALGVELFRAAVAARPLSSLAKHTWRVLGGTHLPTNSLKRLIERAPSGVIVEPSRSDFRDVLANCAVSVSQGGYNTIMDLFATSVRAVVLPFVGVGETEQDFRAQRLEQHGLVRRLEADKLSPLNLAKAVDEVALAPPPPPVTINISGAERTAELVFNAAAHGRSIVLPRKQSE